MKAVVLALAVMGSMASADIIRPGNIKTRTIVGARAERLFNSIDSEEMPEANLQTETVVYKVKRASDGLKQTVCEKTEYRIAPKPTAYRCVIQSSLNGDPVPVFNPHPRMG